MTDLEQQTMSRDDAERLTERIRLTAVSFMETRDKLARYVREAQEGRAHEALGYRSWTEYIAQVFSDTPLMRLTRDERRVIVADLSEQGMSTRAIAPIVGASHETVSKDLQSPVRNLTPASPSTPDEPTFDPTPDWDPTTGEVLAGSGENPPRVTGLDGKTYTRPEPKEDPTKDNDMTEPKKITRKRTPYPVAVDRAAKAVDEALDRFYAVASDTRHQQYPEAITKPLTRTRNHADTILAAIAALTEGNPR